MLSEARTRLHRLFIAGALVPVMLLLFVGFASAASPTNGCNYVPSATVRAEALVLGALIVMIAGFIATGRHLTRIFVGADNRYSNSICQVAIWFGVMMSCYLAALLLRLYGSIGNAGCTTWLVGGIDIPGQVAAMSGLSALTFAGAKAVTVQIDAAAKDANLRNAPQIRQGSAERRPEKTEAARPRLADLFLNDQGQFDIGDFQMLFIAITAAVIYVVSTFAFLGGPDLMNQPTTSLPPVDTSLLAAFGIGQGAYLAKKAASPPGQG